MVSEGKSVHKPTLEAGLRRSAATAKFVPTDMTVATRTIHESNNITALANSLSRTEQELKNAEKYVAVFAGSEPKRDCLEDMKEPQVGELRIILK
jgi:hypothetical protein